MPTQQSSKFPSLDSLPVHATIYIAFAEINKYVAHVMSGVETFHFEIELSHDDIKSLNDLLQDAIQAVGSALDKGAAFENAYQELARRGNYAYKRIFARDLQRVSKALAGGAGKVIQVVSDSFFVPWDLLYDGPLGMSTTIDGYWGTRYCIRRSIEAVENARGYTLPSQLETPRPKVGLVTSDRLPSVLSEEIPEMERLHDCKRIKLEHLHDLSVTKRSEELQELDSFLRQEWHFLHFACHAYEMNPLDLSYLSVTKDFSISMIDFTINNFDLSYHPFVILNACRTGVTNPLYTSSWARKLWELGARGVLATDFKVRDDFAALFSKALYRNLLGGVPIGKALLKARWQFWKRKHNPLGLAYALFSPPSIRVIKPHKP